MLSHSDIKQRRVATTNIVEEVLTKKPFTRSLTQLLLSDSEENPLKSSTWFDLAKLARECLKSLTSEDLKQIYALAQATLEAQGALETYENRYTNISQPGLDGELSKIMLRYRKEGYPHRVASPAAEPELVEEEVKLPSEEPSRKNSFVEAVEQVEREIQQAIDRSHREPTPKKDSSIHQIEASHQKSEAAAEASPHHSVRFDQSQRHSEEKLRQSRIQFH